MEHEEAVRTHATEKYLLGELQPDIRDQFEEHLFDCQDCALDLKAAATFLEHTKVVLSTPEQEPQRVAVPVAAKPGWLSWLRPAIAAPVLAGLLAIVGYQNLVSLPHAKSALQAPQLLPAIYLVSATRGGSTPSVAVRQDEGFLASVDVPSQNRFTSYTAELYDPSNSMEWSLPIPADATKESLSVRIPPVRGGSGTYTLVILGAAGDRANSEVARYPFSLQLQN